MHNWRIKILTSFFLLFLGIVFSHPISADMVIPRKQAFFINQVRASECCHRGSLSSLKKQMEAFEKASIPAYFTLRYDVFLNKDYLSYIRSQANAYPEIIKLGLFLEITPQLAKDAGVHYSGTEKDWFEAQNAYTIGYSPNDRKKVVDYLFQTFYQNFGYYPELTTAWIIDTGTINYLHENYHVKIHEITREQWETDSYTLKGGPRYPYPPSKNWLMIPDYSRIDDLVIVRQTVSDPLKNYGDETNGYTSQPNDYGHVGKSFEYFRALADQALNQPGDQVSFILLGLENSMAGYEQDQFVKQIDYVYQMKSRGQISTPTIDELISFWKQRSINMYGGRDLSGKTNNSSYWIYTPRYRLRVRINNDKVYINDIRLYDVRFSDPYDTYIAQNGGHWVVPYLIDGSLEYQNVLYNQNGFINDQSDVSSITTHINLPAINSTNHSVQFTTQEGINSFSYEDPQEKRITIQLNKDSIMVTPSNREIITYESRTNAVFPISYESIISGFQLKWILNNQSLYSLNTTCQKKSCTLSFVVTQADLSNVRKQQYYFLFPESVKKTINKIYQVDCMKEFVLCLRNPSYFWKYLSREFKRI